MRTLLLPPLASVESSATVEPLEDNTSHCESEPDSKSSLKYVPGASPVPDSANVRGAPATSELTVTVPARAPVADGVNVAATTQLAPAARLDGQLFVCPKSSLASMPAIVTGEPPVFVNVTVWGALVVCVVCEPNANVDGASVSCPPGRFAAAAPTGPLSVLPTFTSSNQTVPALGWFHR